MKKSILIVLGLIAVTAQAASYPVGWVPLLGFIRVPHLSTAQDFTRVVDRHWDYPLRVNYILKGSDYDMARPQYSQRSVASCHELMVLGQTATLFSAKKNTFDEIPQSEVNRYLQTCKAYARTAKMQASKQRSVVSAKELVEFLNHDVIRPGDGTFLDSMALVKRITAIDENHVVVQSTDGSIYIVRKVSWGDYNGDGVEDVQFVIVHTEDTRGAAIGITATRRANGQLAMVEAW